VRDWRARNPDAVDAYNAARREAYGAAKPHNHPKSRAAPRPIAEMPRRLAATEE